MCRAKRCILPAPHFCLDCRQDFLEVPVIPIVSSVLQGLRLMAQPFFLGVEWGCGPSALFFSSGVMGINSYFSPSFRGLFSMSLLTILYTFEGGCLIDNNMGDPTQEGSLLRPYISSVGAVCGKRT